jgi:hypothetical protein
MCLSDLSLGSFITPCPSPFNHVCVHRRTITSAKPRTETPDIIPTLPFLPFLYFLPNNHSFPLSAKPFTFSSSTALSHFGLSHFAASISTWLGRNTFAAPPRPTCVEDELSFLGKLSIHTNQLCLYTTQSSPSYFRTRHGKLGRERKLTQQHPAPSSPPPHPCSSPYSHFPRVQLYTSLPSRLVSRAYWYRGQRSWCRCFLRRRGRGRRGLGVWRRRSGVRRGRGIGGGLSFFAWFDGVW